MIPPKKSKKRQFTLKERQDIADLKEEIRNLNTKKSNAKDAASRARSLATLKARLQRKLQESPDEDEPSSAAAPEPVQAAVLEAPEPVQAVAQQPVPVQDFIDLTDD